MNVGRTSLYICAQLNSSGGGNTSTVHKRSTCSTYWRMVPLQRGLKIQRRRYSQSGFHPLTTEARVRFIVWETLFLWHLLFIWNRHCVNFCIFKKILGFFLSTILMTKNYRMCDFQTFVLTPWHWGRRDRDRIVVGFTTTYMQSVSITTKVVSSNAAHGEVYSIPHYEIKFVRAVVFSVYSMQFPPPIKMTATI